MASPLEITPRMGMVSLSPTLSAPNLHSSAVVFPVQGALGFTPRFVPTNRTLEATMGMRKSAKTTWLGPRVSVALESMGMGVGGVARGAQALKISASVSRDSFLVSINPTHHDASRTNRLFFTVHAGFLKRKVLCFLVESFRPPANPKAFEQFTRLIRGFSDSSSNDRADFSGLETIG